MCQCDLQFESASTNVFSANFALGNAKMSLESASLGAAHRHDKVWMSSSALVGRILSGWDLVLLAGGAGSQGASRSSSDMSYFWLWRFAGSQSAISS